MARIAEWLKIDGERVDPSLQEACAQVHAAEGELVLDFSAVRRLEGSGLAALEKLAGSADEKKVKVVLRGVNIDVYKVLKLARLSPRFAFLT